MGNRTRYITMIVTALLVMGAPLVIDDRFVIKVLTFAGINVITVIGLSILFGYAGQISLGHAAFLGIGAYTSAYVTVELGWPWLAGVTMGASLAGIGGLLLALPSLRLKGHYLAMATLAFGELMFIFFVEAEPITGGVDGFSGIPWPSVFGFEFDTPELNYWLVWGIALLILLLVYNMVRMRPGRAMRALHGSELGAQACGVDIVRIKVGVFVISAMLAGVAGALYGHLVGFISPSLFTLHVSVILVAMTVLGGTSSLAGPVISAALLTLLPYLDALIPGLPESVTSFFQDWEADIYGLTIILVMLFAPGGIAGLLRRIRRRLPEPAKGGETA
jgi:branched-chain amino acid transport system permease protein